MTECSVSHDVKDELHQSESFSPPGLEPSRRGVDRILVSGLLLEEEVNMIIKWKAQELAKEHKRISLPPKRM